MLAGLGLFWVGAVLFCNGLWVLNKIGDKEIGVIDVFVGSLTLLIALYLAFGPGADLDSVKGATFLLLFTFTYFWVAWNCWNGADGRGLGWFCLFVAITCAPICAQTLLASHGNFWQVWLGICWASWGILWFCFYLILGAWPERTRQIYRHSVHGRRCLHRVDTRLSLGHRLDAWSGKLTCDYVITSARRMVRFASN